MKIVICGSRTFDDYDYMCDKLRIDEPYTLVISGGARGADALAQRYAYENEIPLRIIHADWKKHGRSAGMLRNIEMAEVADKVFAFWDGVSVGTKHMIEYCKSRKIPIDVFQWE